MFEHVAFSSEPGARACQSAILGDLDADGYDELLVIDQSRHELTESISAGVFGAAYLFYGRANFPAQLSVLDAELIIRGAAVGAGLGDLNGDGYDDAGVASSCTCDEHASNAFCACPQASGVLLLLGGTQRYFGQHRADLVGLHLPEEDLQVWELAGAGDLNGDGFADFVTGGNGTQRVFAGSLSLQMKPPRLSLPAASIDGVSFSAKDLDADGFDDLMVQGEQTKLFYGSAKRFVDGLGNADATFTHDLDARAWPAPVGDLDGDGKADLALPGFLRTRFLYSGDSRFEGTLDAQLRDFSLITRYGTLAGMTTTDLNGDRARDILLAAKTGSTASLLLLAGSGDRLGADLLIGKEQLIPAGTDFQADACLSNGGDVNGDGFEDVAVGVAGGGVWLLLGAPFDD